MNDIDQSIEAIRCLEQKLEYSRKDNPWLTIFFDRVLFPDGAEGRYNRIIEGKTGHGVAILPITARKELCMIKIYRYPLGRWQWEIPRGFSEPGLTSEENAIRELLEETGLSTQEMIHLGSIFPNSGLLTTEVDVYIAQNVKPSSIRPNIKEAIKSVRFFTFNHVEEMVRQGEIQDSFTLASLYLLMNNSYALGFRAR